MRRFVAVFAVLFAVSVGMNAAHLGADAAIHWDAATCLETADPMPSRAMLEAAAAHVYDVAPRSADPAVATAAFAAAPWPAHRPLDVVRRYYSQVAYAVARAAFHVGSSVTGSAVGGVVAFQLTAAALVAAAVAMLVTVNGRPITAVVAFATVAVVTTPVFLSLSRQVLTETVGLPLMVGTVVVAVVAVRPGRGVGTAVALGAAVGCLAFATVRARYSLGPTMAVLLTGVFARPLIVGDARPSGPPLKGWIAPVVAAAVALFGCVCSDRLAYGAFLWPWTYDDLLVRSTRLYFHSGPEPFWVGAYVSWPLIVLPAVVVVAAVATAPRGVWAWAVGVTVALSLLLVGTERQAVAYQPRHLFAGVGGMAAVMLLVVGHVRWSRGASMAFVAVCVAVVGLNAYSAFGPQRATLAIEFPPTVADRLRTGPVLPALLGGYADVADNRRLHDALAVLRTAGRTPGAVVSVDAGTDAAYSYAVLAPAGGPRVVVGADAAAAFAVGPRDMVWPGGGWERVPVALDRAVLWRRR